VEIEHRHGRARRGARRPAGGAGVYRAGDGGEGGDEPRGGGVAGEEVDEAAAVGLAGGEDVRGGDAVAGGDLGDDGSGEVDIVDGRRGVGVALPLPGSFWTLCRRWFAIWVCF
jgi:hypothetical protein